jgi:hypothetical protein
MRGARAEARTAEDGSRACTGAAAGPVRRALLQCLGRYPQPFTSIHIYPQAPGRRVKVPAKFPPRFVCCCSPSFTEWIYNNKQDLA